MKERHINLARVRTIARERFTPAGRRESFQQLAGNVFDGAVRQADLHKGRIQSTSQGDMKFYLFGNIAHVLFDTTSVEITAEGQPQSLTYGVQIFDELRWDPFPPSKRKALRRINAALTDLGSKEPQEMV